MKRAVTSCVVVIVVLAGLTTAAFPSELRQGTLESDLVPSPVRYSVILPDGYDGAEEPLPLLVLLHGGKSSNEELVSWKVAFDELWAEGRIFPVVVAMPNTGTPTIEGRSEYVDFHDGSQKWYSFVMGPFLSHIRHQYHVSAEAAKTAIGGYSMGGLGALRFAFKNPDKFAGVAGWEPSVLPAYYWTDVRSRNRFHYSDEFLEKIYGKPFVSNWEANNPALIAKTNADALRDSKLQIYIECGDEDYLNLDEGTEFLHRSLWDLGIPHEYHSVRGADHLGRTLDARSREGLQFLDRALNPLAEDQDPARREMIELWRDPKTKAEQESPDRTLRQP
jgi:S-formylglutathione hydrolase